MNTLDISDAPNGSETFLIHMKQFKSKMLTQWSCLHCWVGIGLEGKCKSWVSLVWVASRSKLDRLRKTMGDYFSCQKFYSDQNEKISLTNQKQYSFVELILENSIFQSYWEFRIPIREWDVLLLPDS